MAIRMPPASKPVDEGKAAAFIAATPAPPKPVSTTEPSGKSVVNLRMDGNLLARVDAAAKRQGISRTAWLHVAASKALDT